MDLTKEQEEQLIRQYLPKIWATVKHYKAATTSDRDNQDDLFQESAIVFLRHIRTCDTEEEIRMYIPVRDMINAMSLFNLKEQTVTYPKRTNVYRPRNTPLFVSAASVSEVDMDDRYWDMTIDNVVENMTFRTFFDRTVGEERDVLMRKMDGMCNRDIARDMGITDVRVSRILSRLKDKYQKFVS